MLSLLVLDRTKRITCWILAGISSEEIKPFDIGLDLTMRKVIPKFNNSFLVQNRFFIIV